MFATFADTINKTTIMKEIYFAGGCFWGTEHFFKQVEGVKDTETGFAETVKVVYDDNVVSLRFLLEMFFHAIDPTILNRQGHDEGTRYRTGVYFVDDSDEAVIRSYFADVQKFYDKPIVTEISKLQNYYPAEEYHQDYLDKHPDGYCHLPLELFEFAKKAKERK